MSNHTVGLQSGGTKEGEISRTAELLNEIVKREHGAYYAIAFICDIGYGREDLVEIMGELEKGIKKNTRAQRLKV